MTLDEMCLMAARYSDRYDEFIKNDYGAYEDEAEHYFNVFRDAINEAYFNVSRQQAMPDVYTLATVETDGTLHLENVFPAVYAVKDVLDERRTKAIPYTFETKYVLKLCGVSAGDVVTLYYHYIPDRLEDGDDEPVFSEAMVDPMVYITLAVARMWQSEKNFEYANMWMQQYYVLIREVRSSAKNSTNRRIPRRIFR